jgi:hypothetical protein
MKNREQKVDPLQLRIPRDEKRGAELAAKLQKIAVRNGLSLNDVANMAVAAGLGIVERKLAEIHSEEPQAA